jgi:glycosyltransferase involved in cell wall biosynthesis
VKILIVTNMAPFVRGAVEVLATDLARNLNATPGLSAEILRVPFKREPPERLLEEMFIARSLRLTNVDRVIAMEFPTHLIPHEHKTIWLMHQFRPAYDPRAADRPGIPDTPRGAEIRRAVVAAENACFRTAYRVFPGAWFLRDRLLKDNNFDSEVLPLPLGDLEPFVNQGYGDYIFAGGRINAGGRQHLLVEAMRHVRSEVQLVVAGPLDHPADGELVREQVRKYGLEGRVTLEFGSLPRENLVDRISHALACAYVPIDEDAAGADTREALYASKAIVTTSDSDWTRDFICDGETGLVIAPQPDLLADSFDRLFRDRKQAKQLGKAAKGRLLERHLTWPRTIERLLA